MYNKDRVLCAKVLRFDRGNQRRVLLSLKCCNKVCQLVESIALYDTEKQKHRVLVVGRCKNPKCGCLKAEFIYYDVTQGKFIHRSVPTAEVAATIKKFQKAPFLSVYSTKIRYGTMGNMHWKYHKNGCMYDFNNVLLEKLEREMKIYEDD